MPLKPTLSRILFKVFAFGMLWACGGAVFTLLELGVIGELDYYPSTGVAYVFKNNIITTPIMSFFGGSLLMLIDIFLISRQLKKRSFLVRILIKTFFFILIIIVTTLLSALIGTSVTLEASPFSSTVWQSINKFFGNFAFWSIQLYAGFVTILFLFIIEVSDNLGYQVFWNFFVGKYKKAKVETRVFMFLDLKGSTRIAESLGVDLYYEFLNDFYSDISTGAFKHYGTIYQFVGDEVVVHWPIAHSSSALDSVFEIKSIISSQEPKYQKKYGIMPSFRVGIHGGKVAVGEVGTIKKDILYIGDVLNATSRIQGLCKTHQVDLLISEDIYKAVISDQTAYQFEDKGCSELRGKTEKVNLYAVY